LTLNYRTTAENLGFAMGILEGETFVDVDGEADSVGGYRSARSGPAPRVGNAPTLGGELDIAEEHIRAWLKDGENASIGVLTNNMRDVDGLIDGRESRGIDLRAGEGPGRHGLTRPPSKGMEFTRVGLARSAEGPVPAQARHGLTAEDLEHLRRR